MKIAAASSIWGGGAPAGASRTLLIVDDSATVRSLIKVFLMGRSYEFVEAEEGRGGMLLARTKTIDGAIVDLNMPGVDGIAFLRQLRGSDRPRLRDLPVIVLTSDKSKEARKDGLAAGANAFLQKPVAKARLTDVVDVYLSRNAHRSREMKIPGSEIDK